MQNQVCKVLAMAVLTTGLSVAAGAQSVKTLISLPNAPLALSANPVTNKIYVVVPTNGAETTDNLTVIDGKSDTTLQDIAVPAGASYVAVDYLANRIYVAGCNFFEIPAPCTVTTINGKTNAVINTIAVTSKPGFGLTGIAVSPLTGLVYVANGSDNVINIIDGCKGKLAGTISLNGNSPFAIAINPILNRLYVPYGTNLTAVVDAGKKKILSTTDFGTTTVGAAANIVTGHVFVTDAEFGPSATGVLDQNGKLLANVAVGDSPLGVDVDPVTNLAFVASTALDDVTVIDGKTNTVKTTVFNVPANYIAVNFVSQKVYVSGRTGVTVLTEK